MCEKCNLEIINESLNIDGVEFKKLYFSSRKDKLIGKSDDNKFFIKIQNININHTKLNNLKIESEIFKYLTSRESVCTPKYYYSGYLSESNYLTIDAGNLNSFFYLIVENIEGRNSKIHASDIEIALLELMNFGIFYSDLKFDNLIFDETRSICFVVDHDQTVISPISDDRLEAKVDKLRVSKNTIMGNTDLEKNLKIYGRKKLFKGSKLNLDSCSLVKYQKSTNVKKGHYHEINSKFLTLTGIRGVSHRKTILDKVNFSSEEKVIDMGCNLGLASQLLSLRGLSVVGVEIDVNTLNLAKYIRNIEGFNYTLIQNYKYLDFEDNKKNTILLFSVLHHVYDIQEFTKWINLNIDRILIECRPNENGKQNFDSNWVDVQKWSFKDEIDLSDYLMNLFDQFKEIKHVGDSDKGRKIYEIRK